MKIVSAGTVILVGGRQVLLGHVTNSGNKWDLPKGKIDKGEIPIDSAIRECNEEFGLRVSKLDMVSLGHFQYRINKDLILYFTTLDSINIGSLSCSSFVGGDKTFPEIDGYKLVDINDLPNHFCGAMDRLFASNGLYTMLERLVEINSDIELNV